MNIKRAKEEIKDTLRSYLMKDEAGEYVIPAIRQRPVLLIGPPGVGKTQIMEQAARECGVGLVSYTITHHTRQSAVGLPFIEHRAYGGREYAVTEYTMSEIVAAVYEKMERTGLKEGILFIDEINCVSETLAPTMLQFLQCKTFGNHKIPEGWLIAAAGNPPEYNKSVREFDVVTLDRLKLIHVEPDFEVWKEYAYREKLHPAILSYLNIRRQNFCQIETTVDGKRFATPRGWEDLSEFIYVYERLGKRADREVVGQYIQFPKISKDFANYLELYYKYQNDYQVDGILAGTWSEGLCDQVGRAAFDEKLSLVGLLLSRLSGAMGELADLEQVMELVMGRLKGLRERLLSGELSAQEALFEAAREVDEETERKETQGLLSRKEKRILRRAGAMLEQWRAGEAGSVRGEAAWDWLRERFSEASDGYEAMRQACGDQLERAFDFMEAAFGDGQEMVIFITELNSSWSCLHFLKEYGCKRYDAYNRQLLFEGQEKDIRETMDRMKGRE